MARARQFIAAAVIGLAVLSGAATARQLPPNPPGTYIWYWDPLHENQAGYVIYECDGSRQGPFGWMTIYEEYIPLAC